MTNRLYRFQVISLGFLEQTGTVLKSRTGLSFSRGIVCWPQAGHSSTAPEVMVRD